jgi:hypothetical protein
MNALANQAVYRIRQHVRESDKPMIYQESLEIADDRTGEVLAHCDLFGLAALSRTEIVDKNYQTWQMKPVRTFKSSRWIVTDPENRIAMQIDQKAVGKFINPVYKVLLVLRDWEENVKFRLVEPKTEIPDRVLPVDAGEFAIMAGDKPAAKLTWLPRQDVAAKGFFGKLKKLLIASDRAIVSAGPQHCLDAPTALAMYLVFDDSTDIAGG